MRRTVFFSFIISFLCVSGSLGCYRTVVRSPQSMQVGPTYEQRQWFTVGGLVGLSGEAGAECGASGLSYSESRMGGMDIAITLGLGMVGGLAGAMICDSEAEATAYAACTQGIATVVPFLISSRTVTYTCAGTGVSRTNLPLVPTTTSQSAQSSSASLTR